MKQKSLLAKLLQGNGVTAIAVVLLSVSFGAVALPGLFADTVKSSLTNVRATPSNDNSFTVRLDWKGTTSADWRGDYSRNGSKVGDWTTKAKTITFSDLTCGADYTFRVAAIGGDGGLETSYKTVHATTKCPAVADFSLVSAGTAVASSWKNSSGLQQTYNFYLKTGNNPALRRITSSTAQTMTATCGTTYSAYVVPVANGQSGAASPIATVTTPACTSSKH